MIKAIMSGLAVYFVVSSFKKPTAKPATRPTTAPKTAENDTYIEQSWQNVVDFFTPK